MEERRKRAQTIQIQKNLDEKFLVEKLGVEDTENRRCIKIPYWDENLITYDYIMEKADIF